MLRPVLAIAAVSVLLITAACGGASSADKTKTAQAGKPTAAAEKPTSTVAAPTATAFGAATAIKVAAKDYSFTLDKSSGPAGDFTFSVTNTGPTGHEFVIFKTDLAADKLTIIPDELKVDENGPGVTHIDEIGDLKVGDTKTLTVKLEPGKYVLVCNLPSHYTQGMFAAFTVQ